MPAPGGENFAAWCDVHEFFDFAKNKIDSVTYALLKADDRALEIVNKDLDFQVTPSRRKLIQVMSHFHEIESMDWLNKEGMHILSAFLGDEFATMFLKTYKETNARITIEEILKWSKKTQDRIKQFTTGNVRLDLIDNANNEILKYLKEQKKKKTKMPQKDLGNILNFLFCIPADVMRTFIEKLMEEIKTINGRDLADQIFDHAENLKPPRVDIIKVIVDSYQ